MNFVSFDGLKIKYDVSIPFLDECINYFHITNYTRARLFGHRINMRYLIFIFVNSYKINKLRCDKNNIQVCQVFHGIRSK